MADEWELLRRCEAILAERDVPEALLEAIATVRAELGRALSPREVELMGLMAEGHTHGEIAARMHISKSTVGRHIDHIRDKLGARNQAHAVALFVASRAAG